MFLLMKTVITIYCETNYNTSNINHDKVTEIGYLENNHSYIYDKFTYYRKYNTHHYGLNKYGSLY